MSEHTLDRIVRGITVVVFTALFLVSVLMIVYSLAIEDYGLTLGAVIAAVMGFAGATKTINF
jgi:hypothetical protein